MRMQQNLLQKNTKMNKIDFLMGKLHFMSKALGGEGVNAVHEKKKKEAEFDFLVMEIKEATDHGRELLDRRDQVIQEKGKESKERIILENEIREIINKGRAHHEKCRVLLRKQRQAGKTHEIHLKEKGLDGLLNNITLLEKLFKNAVQPQRRKALMGDGGGSQDLYAERSESENGELHDFEKEALGQFKQNDAVIDELLGQINKDLDEIDQLAQGIGDNIERENKKVLHLEKKVKQTNETLRLQNNDLKKILHKYRSSNKLCVDIALILILLALLGVLYNIIKGKV